MSEKTIERSIITEITTRGGMVTNTTGVAVAGTPDLLAAYRGHPLALEVKTPTGRATRLQLHHLQLWAAAGAHAHIVRSRQHVRELLNHIDTLEDQPCG